MRVFLLLLLPACLAAQGLRIRVVESSGPVHVAGSRTTTPLIVEILEGAGAPAQGAVVSFRLPASGPGGTFANGSTTDVVTAGADGRATAPSVRWNTIAGAVELLVTASKGALRASLVSRRRLLPSAESAVAAPIRRSRRRLVVIVASVAAGAVAAGLSMGRRASAASAESQPPAPTLSLGPPVITVGPP